VDWKKYPCASGCVRAYTPPGGGFILTPVEGNPSKSRMVNFMCADIKGWVPRSVLETTLGGALFNFYTKVVPAALDKYADMTEADARAYVDGLLLQRRPNLT